MRNPNRVTRRKILEVGVAASVIMFTAGISGDVLDHQPGSNRNVSLEEETHTGDQITWKELKESGYTPDPVQVNLAVVALNAVGIKAAKSQEQIKEEITEQTRRITNTTFDSFTFNTAYYEEHEKPDTTKERDGEQVPLYSQEQLGNIVRRYKEIGKATMVLLMVNSADIDDTALGRAHQNLGGLPTAVIRSTITGGNAIGHELGHLLNVYILGPGMHHEKVINTSLRDKDGKCKQSFAFDTIQQLIANETCAFEARADNPTEVNEYASPYSIMGSSIRYADGIDTSPDAPILEVDPSGNKIDDKPVFSSAEQCFLNPSLKTTVTTEPGRYDISIEPGKNFGVRMKLPGDHALHQLVPEAEEIFIGALEGSRISSDGTKNNDSIDGIGTFVTYDSGRGTILLDIGLQFKFEKDSSNENYEMERAIYADEQLNVVVLAGYDGAAYTRLVQLDTPEGQEYLSEARRVAAERNDLIMSKHKDR